MRYQFYFWLVKVPPIIIYDSTLLLQDINSLDALYTLCCQYLVNWEAPIIWHTFVYFSFDFLSTLPTHYRFLDYCFHWCLIYRQYLLIICNSQPRHSRQCKCDGPHKYANESAHSHILTSFQSLYDKDICLLFAASDDFQYTLFIHYSH